MAMGYLGLFAVLALMAGCGQPKQGEFGKPTNDPSVSKSPAGGANAGSGQKKGAVAPGGI